MQLLKLFIVVISGFLSFESSAQVQKRNVAVIYSYPRGEWFNGIHNGLNDTLNKYAKGRYQVFDFLYDYEGLKFKPKEAQLSEVEKIRTAINKIDPAFIVINDDEAVEKFIGKFPKEKPVILNAINQSPKLASWSSGVDLSRYCGIIEHYPIEESLKMISLMVKDLKQMSVVSSQGDSSKIVSKIFEGIQRDKSSSVRVREIYLKSSWEDWKKSFLEINRKDQLAWILVPYEVFGKDGKPVGLQEMASWIKANVKIPLLGILSIHTKMGFLAAISVDPYGLGKQAGELIILQEKGEACSGIGFLQSKYHVFEVNTDEVSRLGLKIPEQFIGVAKFIKSSSPEEMKR